MIQDFEYSGLDELKELAAKYPFASTLHKLILDKEKELTGFQTEAAIYKASAIVSDRRLLFNTLYKEEHTDEAPLHEVFFDQSESEADDVQEHEIIEEEIEIAQYFTFSEDTDLMLSQEESVPAEVPEAISEFARWLHQKRKTTYDYELKQAGAARETHKFTTVAEPAATLLPEKKKKKKKKKKELLIINFAEQSLIEQDNIVSETLANVLASQGHFEKAIEMFKKLSLLFPEKSNTFADQIQKLKSNL